MSGVSLSLFAVDTSSLALLDASTLAPAWVPSADLLAAETEGRSIPLEEDAGATGVSGEEAEVEGEAVGTKGLLALQRVCARLVEIEAQLTEYDMVCGDGDCGVVVKRGALCVAEAFAAAKPTLCASALCDRVAAAVSSSMGGTSGALLELFFRAMASHFSLKSREGGWEQAVQIGVSAIKFYGGADQGMRTMLVRIGSPSFPLSSQFR